MKTSSMVLPMLFILAIFHTGCLEETVTNKYEENILTENLIIPSTFQELSGLFLELNVIVLIDDEEEASLSYIYESTEVINGVEADKFIYQVKDISFGKLIAEAWYDPSGELIRYTLTGDNFGSAHEAEQVDGLRDSSMFLFDHFYNDDHQGIYRAIFDDSDYLSYKYIGSSIESFGDLKAPVYTVGILGSGDESPPTMYYYIADFGHFQTVVGLKYSSEIVDTGESREFRINRVVLKQD